MSKELEALQRMYYHLDLGVFIGGDYPDCRKDMSILEKSLKVLQIIKEKKVNINAFLKSINAKGNERIWQYNKWTTDETRHLTKDEFDLLKEVLL